MRSDLACSGHFRSEQAPDKAWHGRMLSSSSELVDFSVEGSYDPSTFGLYYTKVQLGNPSKDFYVQIDTGSDVLWVNCDSCHDSDQSIQSFELEFRLYGDLFQPDMQGWANVVGLDLSRFALQL
ncbi:hypothetical protein MLD38_040187 [Melastoma candidum]|uniref:Uncharacterized protein n=1 Tax=Melastoma candidum TaxID=119954 RepID=A0ACB9L4Y7_9MYRT|nr:hypothetical protein MLD38_040187 [Melastoma candidum]